MILDTSALLAILRDEPGALECAVAIEAAATRRVAAATLLEAAIMIDANGDPVAGRKLDELIRTADVRIELFSAEHIGIARQAYRDFGRGSGHPAKLDFGDCLAYALAVASGEPLLFTSVGFGYTDVRSAIPPMRDT